MRHERGWLVLVFTRLINLRCFVWFPRRGETSNGDTEDTEPVVNPEEIDIDEDEDDNEEGTYTCRFHFTLAEIGSVWFSFTLLHQAKNDHKSTVLLSDTLNVVKETVDYVLIGKMANL